MKRPLHVLFLCTGNSARSILAERFLAISGGERFRAFSAGSHPKGSVHPLALELLERQRVSTDGLRSKSWDEFAEADAPPLDFVFTVCDSAAAEMCPVWPGQPMSAHWGVPDPAAVEGDLDVRRRAFLGAWTQLSHRIRIFTSLPIERLDRLSLQQRIDAIGREAAS
ncbi:MAG: arsenate reductase ArsC [Burkholderiales bacterium]|jgi:arsenate reductase|nr:arsenate reductase ArsC [Burkholderiales bacterium]